MCRSPVSQGASRRWGRTLLILLAILLVGFVALQLVPVPRTNPPVVSEPHWDSPQTADLAERACYDCHSNETVWPWYAYVAPLSFRIASEVNEGREKLNFSDWSDAAGEEAGETEELTEVLTEGKMPPPPYIAMHPTAKLSAAEMDQLAGGLVATVRADPPGGTGEQHEEREDDD